MTKRRNNFESDGRFNNNTAEFFKGRAKSLGRARSLSISNFNCQYFRLHNFVDFLKIAMDLYKINLGRSTK
jgi:hypothetical protein